MGAPRACLVAGSGAGALRWPRRLARCGCNARIVALQLSAVHRYKHVAGGRANLRLALQHGVTQLAFIHDLINRSMSNVH